MSNPEKKMNTKNLMYLLLIVVCCIAILVVCLNNNKRVSESQAQVDALNSRIATLESENAALTTAAEDWAAKVVALETEHADAIAALEMTHTAALLEVQSELDQKTEMLTAAEASIKAILEELESTFTEDWGQLLVDEVILVTPTEGPVVMPNEDVEDVPAEDVATATDLPVVEPVDDEVVTDADEAD